jgi:hypothetical protein
MDFALIKICPSCGSEYRRDVERCSDCGVALEAWTPPPLPADRGLSGSDTLTAVSFGDPWQLERQARHLQAQGFASRIDTTPPGEPIRAPRTAHKGSAGHTLRLALYVEESVADEARRVVEEVEAARGPAPPAPPGPAGAELDACPACGAPAAPSASSCSECGLAFPTGWSTCPVCEASVTLDDERCRSCGEVLERDAP